MGSCRSAPWSTAAESKQTTTLQIDSLIMVAPKSVRLAIVAERGRAIGPTPPLRCVLGVDRRRVETLTAVDRGPSLVARHSYLDRAETAFAMTVPGHETNLIDSAISAATPLRAQPGGVGADGVRRRMTAPRSVQGFILGDSGQLDYRRASIGSGQSLDVDVDEAVVRWPKRGRARRRCRAVECPRRSPGDHRCRSVVAYLRRPGFLGEERDRVAAPFSGIGAHLHGERRILLGACRNDDGGRPGDRPGEAAGGAQLEGRLGRSRISHPDLDRGTRAGRGDLACRRGIDRHRLGGGREWDLPDELGAACRQAGRLYDKGLTWDGKVGTEAADAVDRRQRCHILDQRTGWFT